MKLSNSLVLMVVLTALMVSISSTMTTLDIMDRMSRLSPERYDEDTTGALSGLVNVTVNESVVINWVIDSINFTLNTVESGLSPVEDNTADDSPFPFVIRNDGSTNANVTIYANDDLWSVNGYRTVTDGATLYFAFKCRHNESYCDNATHANPNSTVTWDAINGTGNAELLAFNFSYADGTTPNGDEIALDINVSVPPGETVGSKTSTLVLTAVTACTNDANCDSF